MANYDLAVSWSGKDGLADSSTAKVISGGDFHTEFTAVKAAVNTKADVNGSASEAFSATTATAGTDSTVVATTAFVGAALTAATINDLVYPVGSIYFNAAVATNPNTLLGFGTWADYGGGRTTAEMPAHTHTYGKSTTTENMSIHDISGLRGAATTNTGSTGGGDAHNNIQPYITVYMWKRTA